MSCYVRIYIHGVWKYDRVIVTRCLNKGVH